MYHYSPVSDVIAAFMLISVVMLVLSPMWAPILYFTLGAIRDMQRERLIERREREEREARIRAYNAMAYPQQPTLPSPPPPAYLPPPQQQAQPLAPQLRAGRVIEQPSTALAPRRSRVVALAQALDRLMGEDIR
jgi:hypothetical protein